VASGGDPRAARMALFRRARPLKRWRYVAIFNDELMACAACVQIGPARQTFWALHLRRERLARERTRLLPRRGEVELRAGGRGAGVSAGAEHGAAHAGHMRIRDRGVDLDLTLAEDAGFEARCPNGRSEVWTRKQAGVCAVGTLALDGGPARSFSALAVIDDTAGYHARETEWCWSAGVGESADGVAVAWNLVSGVNDPPTGSERAVWLAGRPSEAPAVSFATDLSSVTSEDGCELRFEAESERSRHDHLLLVSSDYRAPFGTFSGTLPGGVPLAGGVGVMEHHRARW
jgi:hypothetical protein